MFEQLDDPNPPIPDSETMRQVQTRARNRRRREFEIAITAIVLVATAATLTSIGLTRNRPAGTRQASSSSLYPGIHQSGRGDYPPMPPPCPPNGAQPTVLSGHFCGPDPQAGNGSGLDGSCSGAEVIPPCGSGAQPGIFYNYTLPINCDHTVFFNGDYWNAQLDAPRAQSPSYVWIVLQADGTMRIVSSTQSVGHSPVPPGAATIPPPSC